MKSSLGLAQWCAIFFAHLLFMQFNLDFIQSRHHNVHWDGQKSGGMKMHEWWGKSLMKDEFKIKMVERHHFFTPSLPPPPPPHSKSDLYSAAPVRPSVQAGRCIFFNPDTRAKHPAEGAVLDLDKGTLPAVSIPLPDRVFPPPERVFKFASTGWVNVVPEVMTHMSEF